ncbi:hypothetical protein [Archangium gephyra]|uniref:Uncharacterized protein n=1 Tax=Archangium gephyra TaxID=48 RepID=A0AAC8Q082_9BACT|nr:hypothetical protein [Archangium gephyra]AKI98450.1 Hypothetical protein AA314_00077 [Archangium gephyra]
MSNQDPSSSNPRGTPPAGIGASSPLPSPSSSGSTLRIEVGRPRNVLREPAPWLVADSSRALDINHRITQGYIQLAHDLQGLLDPAYRPGGSTRVLCNWFAFAPHASLEAGKGMLGAYLARAIIDTAQGEPSPSVKQALDRGGLSGPDRLVAEKVAGTLRFFGLSHDVAASLGTLLSAANLDVFVDPRTLWITTWRVSRVVQDAPGATPLDKAEAVVRTLEQLLLDGNVAIYGDIATSARAYLDWRERSGGNAVKPLQVVEGFALDGATAGEARRAREYALAHVKDSPQPTHFATVLPGVGGRSLLLAAFALFEDARQTEEASERDALIGFANNYLAWHEQHNAVQPAFTPSIPRQGEVPRDALMHAMTPTLRLPLGPIAWEFSDYTERQPDRDHNLLTSKPTEYNWALFEDRWPAILDAFDVGYQHQTGLWQMPQPLIQSLDLLEVG